MIREDGAGMGGTSADVVFVTSSCADEVHWIELAVDIDEVGRDVTMLVERTDCLARSSRFVPRSFVLRRIRVAGLVVRLAMSVWSLKVEGGGCVE